VSVLWYILQFVIGFNLLLPLTLFVLNRFKKKKEQPAPYQNSKAWDYAIIVTAYQETVHIPATVHSILNLNYNNYLVYVVLDNCDDISSLQFSDDKIILLRPEAVLAGNIKSHFFAISNFKRNHDVVTIIDSDNLVESNYLNVLNEYFNSGYEAVQGVREAKNLDSTIACLDAARDLYYHFYDGYILFNSGSSATLAGSGMAFTTQLYKETLKDVLIEGAGFDKVLQYQIVKRNTRIAFAEKAVVFDQKTSDSTQLVNQRARWINTWFKYFKLGFILIIKGVKNVSINQLLFGVILLRPPLFLFLTLSLMLLFVNIFINPLIALMWIIGLLVFILGFLIAIKKSNTDRIILRALRYIPVFIYYQFISLFKSKNANKRSVATRHFEQP